MISQCRLKVSEECLIIFGSFSFFVNDDQDRSVTLKLSVGGVREIENSFEVTQDQLREYIYIYIYIYFAKIYDSHHYFLTISNSVSRHHFFLILRT